MASFVTILFVHLWERAAAVLAAALSKPVCEKAAHIRGSYFWADRTLVVPLEMGESYTR